MRALVVLLLFSVACAAVVFSVLEWRKRSTPEAKRTDSIADLSRRAAAAASDGRHAEAERLDYAAQRIADGFASRHPGRPRRFPLDDFDQSIIDRHDTLSDEERRLADDLRRRVDDLMADRQRSITWGSGSSARRAGGSDIPEHLRERAEEARRKSQSKDDT